MFSERNRNPRSRMMMRCGFAAVLLRRPESLLCSGGRFLATRRPEEATTLRIRLALAGLLLVLAVPCSAVPPSWDEVVFADEFDAITDCPDTILVPDGTQRLRLLKSDIQYGAQPAYRRDVPLAEYDDIWGHNNPYDGVTSWPGVAGAAPVFKQFHRWNYVGAHFRTPAIVPPGMAGSFRNAASVPSPHITVAISYACGDFSRLPSPGCLQRDVPSADGTMLYWQFNTSSPMLACDLRPDTDYYINLIQADQTYDPECIGDICAIAPWRGG